jgi:hypothetical protein
LSGFGLPPNGYGHVSLKNSVIGEEAGERQRLGGQKRTG